MNVFDASALLAYLRGEAGADVVRERLIGGGICGAARMAGTAVTADLAWRGRPGVVVIR